MGGSRNTSQATCRGVRAHAGRAGPGGPLHEGGRLPGECGGSSAPRASALTAAELRLLPSLSTHLSFPEIAGDLFLSAHTVKSQARSLYRKLGGSTRSQAVTRSRELGLLEG